MSYKKFENNDLFYNVIKAKPRFEFKIYGNNILINNGASLAILNNMQTVAPPVPTPDCSNPNAFDFSCVDNSHNIGII